LRSTPAQREAALTEKLVHIIQRVGATVALRLQSTAWPPATGRSGRWPPDFPQTVSNLLNNTTFRVPGSDE
jgi:hypothetical protein